MKFLRAYKVGIKDLPFALLVIDFIWWILSLFGVYSLQYWWVQEITSHSLAFVFVMGFYGLIHRYCAYSWACLGGLGLLNLLNIIHYFVDFDYVQSYAGLIIITSLCFAIIKLIKSKKCTP